MSEYSTKKVSELRDECARRYLPRSGCRKALQIRLVDHDKWYSKNAPRTIIEPFAEIYPNGTGSFGAKIVDPAILVGECVTRWRLDSYGGFKLYFEHGKTARITPQWLRCGQLGFDNNLHLQLVYLDGYVEGVGLFKGIAPKIALPVTKAVVARRRSVASKRNLPDGLIEPTLDAWEETHVVIGLRIGSMRSIGYVYGYEGEDDPTSSAFGDVEILRLEEGAFDADEE